MVANFINSRLPFSDIDGLMSYARDPEGSAREYNFRRLGKDGHSPRMASIEPTPSEEVCRLHDFLRDVHKGYLRHLKHEGGTWTIDEEKCQNFHTK